MKRLFLIAVVFAACTSTKIQSSSNNPNTLVVDGKIFTTVYQQRAAEYKALCLQSYNIARFRLDEALRSNDGKPKAIVTDVDETVLDNSLYAAQRGLKGKDYESKSWTEYINLAISDTIPGALSFLQYAGSKGVEIFYITDRKEFERAGTLRNLQRFRYPNADEVHLLTKNSIPGKEARRQQVLTTHDIVLLLGDNLSDFSNLFDKKPYEERMNAVNAITPELGGKFILIPNPIYGDWETALYKYNYSLTPAQKDSVLKRWLKTN
jgi:5'-nucleotidase (lipoprotein e(P4) family)